jgi:hypothetical protein
VTSVTSTPREIAEASITSPQLPDGADERFIGYGVMGLPFSSGHYLALRHFPVTSLGGGYRSVWHRDPDGQWMIHADVPPHLGCARYFGSALAGTTLAEITLTWSDPHALHVTVDDWLSWDVRLRPSAATRAMNGMGQLLPDAAWRSDAVLAAMGRAARPMLGVGRVRLAGAVPNGQHFRTRPKLLWTIGDSTATIRGDEIGVPGQLPQQDRLGDFWLPQRGIFFAAAATFDTYDATRHAALSRNGG